MDLPYQYQYDQPQYERGNDVLIELEAAAIEPIDVGIPELVSTSINRLK